MKTRLLSVSILVLCAVLLVAQNLLQGCLDTASAVLVNQDSTADANYNNALNTDTSLYNGCNAAAGTDYTTCLANTNFDNEICGPLFDGATQACTNARNAADSAAQAQHTNDLGAATNAYNNGVTNCYQLYGGGGGGGQCDSCTCANGCNADCSCIGSEDPIIIDLSGQGYDLTSVQTGVSFDFFAKHKPLQMAWTNKGSDVGFLALDRNGNGRIDDGTELFGNITPQPAKSLRNGFLALAVYDQPASGGNGDGWIDSRDSVYAKLLIWVDKNHNGVSDPGELMTLLQVGVNGISLSYTPATWSDAYGNQFRYRAPIRTTNPAVHVLYDVLLRDGAATSGH